MVDQPDIHNDDWNGVIDNPWRRLRQFTAARIGLGRSGVSLPTKEMLEFQLAHAQARDAVHTPLDFPALTQQLETLAEQYPLLSDEPPLKLHSEAVDRMTYLQRPDLGRRLDEASRVLLQQEQQTPEQPFDLALVIADGLSATAIAHNAVPFIQALCEELQADKQPWKLAPITLVEQGRVAVGDDVGELLNAKTVLVLIGERPGLSSPDSLGLYLTWAPVRGLTDARRNCISNVRPEGLNFSEAAHKAGYLLRESRRLQLSGVQLKDRSGSLTGPADSLSESTAQAATIDHQPDFPDEHTTIKPASSPAAETKNFLLG
ncbi:ethanolamine ammonia-lyase subunit EutC [Thalassolituus alkanivorans]|jgi:ethanolamine ammonia-lyase small subunit|uniref:ethanolamine ammonia-lyase subunit EutC n=1 Tax=Thalassolituus alkanivorans TaxID=2881055 RepID=UPI000C363BFC|nr:ethanolamine ammonia-lyase subunit EutC [Thalassolituus alkanivorans]MAY16005.1 ethanolamine ammonia-lyase [Oceanospirillaceae bacterium]MBU2039610.1 ethanolamine ammonia-lyase subunit EutC [Gammaproteobacteria bacterium]MCB2384970.1 ethanolamine ammonia-lyase subunit EutC [Thalassolituus alkanivorans]MCB2424442.1 ethanolamine ammonia-lyase subunit EutC [Thalassolituus alkanivorans]